VNKLHDSDIRGLAYRWIEQKGMENWREQEEQLRQGFKSALFKELGITGHPNAEKLFQIAWDRGHSYGYSEVYNEALELVNLIREGKE
jgi:hypothetical protein